MPAPVIATALAALAYQLIHQMGTRYIDANMEQDRYDRKVANTLLSEAAKEGEVDAFASGSALAKFGQKAIGKDLFEAYAALASSPMTQEVRAAKIAELQKGQATSGTERRRQSALGGIIEGLGGGGVSPPPAPIQTPRPTVPIGASPYSSFAADLMQLGAAPAPDVAAHVPPPPPRRGINVNELTPEELAILNPAAATAATARMREIGETERTRMTGEVHLTSAGLAANAQKWVAQLRSDTERDVSQQDRQARLNIAAEQVAVERERIAMLKDQGASEIEIRRAEVGVKRAMVTVAQRQNEIDAERVRVGELGQAVELFKSMFGSEVDARTAAKATREITAVLSGKLSHEALSAETATVLGTSKGAASSALALVKEANDESEKALKDLQSAIAARKEGIIKDNEVVGFIQNYNTKIRKAGALYVQSQAVTPGQAMADTLSKYRVYVPATIGRGQVLTIAQARAAGVSDAEIERQIGVPAGTLSRLSGGSDAPTSTER